MAIAPYLYRVKRESSRHWIRGKVEMSPWLCKVQLSPLKGQKVGELLTMSKQELSRVEAMQRIKDKRLTQKEARRMLDLRRKKTPALSPGGSQEAEPE